MTRTAIRTPAAQPNATTTDGASPRPPPPRDEDRAWYDLARDLRTVTPDAPGPAGIDYERAAHRVQCGPASPEDAMIAQAVRGAGHVRADPVAERLARLPSGRGRLVCVWLRGFAPALEWLAADRVQSKRAALLDALAVAGVATAEDVAAWHVAERAVTARRAWARAALREAWTTWYGRAW